MTGGPINTYDPANHRAIALWLLLCCVMVFAMVVLGGVTRLTRSGLSIVEWAPLLGAIPPLSDSAWQQVFDQYRQFPEYQKVNSGMTLEAFQSIYWIEYGHRLLGRLIGLAFLGPFVYFLARKRISRALLPKLIAMFVLGGLQGLLGWLMVKSGLVDVPQVSQYRLTAHLLLAVGIYGFMLWVALDQLGLSKAPAPAALRREALAITSLIVFMIASGGLVAGTRAGFAYNTFPLMAGHWIPPGLMAMQPWPVNLFENITTIQFNHRLLAYALSVAIGLFWWHARRIPLAGRTRYVIHLLPVLLMLQIALGIATLVQGVPVPLAATHQAGAMLVLTCSLFITHRLRHQA